MRWVLTIGYSACPANVHKWGITNVKGTFTAYVYRDQEEGIKVISLEDIYNQAWYTIPKKTRKITITEPYIENIKGQKFKRV